MPSPNRKKLLSFFKKIPLSLSIILFIITILRIPTFFEPYWYGDEGIYLVIGTALNRGAHLYSEIVDHKTPLIYYFARVNSQLEFRFLLYVWMMISTTAFYYIAKLFTKSQKTVILAASIFAIFTTLPWFEGNIANGELFVMGFVLVGLWVLTHTQYFQLLIKEKGLASYALTNQENTLLFSTGFFLGLAILTKVPALFDAVAILGISYFIFLTSWQKNIWNSLTRVITPTVVMAVGILTPILLSVLYFYFLGSGKDYLDFGLLYNFKYAGSWQLGFTNPLLVFFFTLKGKVAFLILATILITLSKKFLSASYQFVIFWFALSFIACLLSNRPYPHYFLQALPPLSLLIALGASKCWWALKHATNRASSVVVATYSVLSLLLFVGTVWIMNVGLYPTVSYYSNFASYITGNLSQEEYFQKFNYLMKENYQISTLLKSENPDKIFIWGTNPMLYALSGTRPVGKFTVAFHIEDLKVYDQTIEQLRNEKPLYIIIMKDQQTELPGLSALLDRYYMPVETTDHMIIWRKLNNKRVSQSVSMADAPEV